ncbi:hypothetical protein HBH98_118390 [Parastagonospora nodorum]|nr:hypothetical protein HBH51_214940 [Parastagonospora nodorum]KAH4039522.1 hypothetical protein HBI09_033080 [Parastagonospora nodorum]KAH4049785.1 hypothetical protein HBH49_137440 [Parastagonospora nodorum]KAH4345358.1 hypothetical protein HBH98_118390 [Parastagonospora nodorum]KAH4375742.1 hypothetical protein HBH97_119390 [Parastagonospora nodorum]
MCNPTSTKTGINNTTGYQNKQPDSMFMKIPSQASRVYKGNRFAEAKRETKFVSICKGIRRSINISIYGRIQTAC